jgi:hypothetical protein
MANKLLGFRTLLRLGLAGVAGCGESEPTAAQKATEEGWAAPHLDSERFRSIPRT